MFCILLWVLHHFITHYAGQTTQGNKDDGDGANHASGSKDAANLPQRTTLINLYTALQESDTPDQSDASLPADSKPGKKCKGGHGIRKISKSCPRQQSPSGSQPSTSHDHPQSDEMPLPAYFRVGIFQYYTYLRKTKQYPEFTKEEAKYFASEYSFKKKLGQGKYGLVSLATRKSNGMEVAYKSIPKSKVRKYTLESSSLPICNLRNPLVGSEEQSVAQCMSSRPPNPLVPYEFLLQKYLSRPGHGSPYVPKVFDYIILKDKFILVMEHFDEKWTTLSSYLMKKNQLDVSEARDIIREIVKAMLSLKRHGVSHMDLYIGNVMYNPETGKVKLIDFGNLHTSRMEEGKSFPLKSSDPSSPRVSKYKAGIKEMKSMQMLGSTSIAHLVVECEQVTGHRIQSGLVPAIQKSRLRLLGRALDPGVENVYTWLCGGVLNGEADLDQLLVGRDCGA
ncbi:hypothetical protein BASA50_005816 [Batrachochytrium salamandrivorans]|uniref:non-specific serine/threonine protein kinase n=1 Tax=Batrachochytrium salamandrivorans TaxID=1357716 RepID=A0ABQ8FD19_9FUNG|nr:hypothetical protein BASA50_005816 [Batrachochytrium salamandrivorans]